jgi:peptide-methionine (S)-S-oxide reductase
MSEMLANRATATLGGGCFWCLEAVYQQLKGVHGVKSGYAGGHVDNPTYREVCGGDTGHAEVVQIEYDPAAVTFDDLLRVFFAIHDPTTQDRQGADVGPQYRSIILYHDDEQREAAERIIDEIGNAGVWDDPIVTQCVPLDRFWPAEDYHDNYFAANGNQPYCQVVIAPKVAKFRKQFIDRLRA